MYELKSCYCKCGCGNGVVLKHYKEDDELIIELVSDNFYAMQKEYGRHSIKEKLRRIWYIIAGKEYTYFNIVLKGEDVKTFKKFVEKM